MLLLLITFISLRFVFVLILVVVFIFLAILFFFKNGRLLLQMLLHFGIIVITQSSIITVNHFWRWWKLKSGIEFFY